MDRRYGGSFSSSLNKAGPPLESLFITCMQQIDFDSDHPRIMKKLLLQHDGRNLRRLHLQAVPIHWSASASLPNLTHLELKHMHMQPEKLLAAVRSMLLLCEPSLYACTEIHDGESYHVVPGTDV